MSRIIKLTEFVKQNNELMDYADQLQTLKHAAIMHAVREHPYFNNYEIRGELREQGFIVSTATIELVSASMK